MHIVLVYRYYNDGMVYYNLTFCTRKSLMTDLGLMQFILHSPYYLIQSIVIPILRLLVYVRCYKIDNRNDRIKETRQECPKQSLYPTIRQPNTFIP